jgi:immune inhibitor A
MTRRIVSSIDRSLLALIVAGSVVATTPSMAHAQDPADAQLDAVAAAGAKGGSGGGNGDDRRHPLGDKQRALRQKALQQRIKGLAPGKVHQVARGQYVELAREGEDQIWTVLGEFGTQIHASYGGTPGPLHNTIPAPDRSVDNTTIWRPDFNRAHYEQTLFSEAPGAISMRNFYIELSANRYTVDGEVTDWGRVAHNEARYGSNYCGSIVCATTWLFVRDSVNAWFAAQIAAGRTAADIDAYLSRYDVWDRYDHDGDGNFNEPDGYIDHFQSVHAGEGEETGGGVQGSQAIWSHRWYVQLTPVGAGGPTLDDGTVVPLGGTRVGTSKYWIGDYTIEPENGGVGVFAHEFGHDLGLPDLYDTSGGENSTEYWTLMSGGSYGNDGTIDIGTRPTHMGAWEKFQLGWLNYEVAFAGAKSSHKIGPSAANTKQAQGLFVLLPDKQVTVNLGPPHSGTKFYYSGSGDGLDVVMYRQFTLPAAAALTAQVRYDIEQDWDYAYLVASTDGGATWQNVPTSRSTATDPNGQNFGNGITGTSAGLWVTLDANLSAYAGNVLLGFRYWTDGAVVERGFMVDDIQISGQPVDGAESEAGWTFTPADGFRVSTGVDSTPYFNTYLAEFRQYRGYDDSLRTGAYNFGFLDNPALGNWVERFPYQDGLLISYWDGSQGDNDTSLHPGSGLILPIDAHPDPLIRPGGAPWRARIQSYDSPFALDATDAISLHRLSQPVSHGSLPGVPRFDDRIQHWRAATPLAGVKNPNTGTIIEVRSVSALGTFLQVQVRPAK